MVPRPLRRRCRSLATTGPIVVALLSLLAASTPPTSLAQPAEWVSFETTDQSALPIIRARLNGSEGYRLVIDVSFVDNVLDNTLIAGSGMELASRNEQKTINYYGHEETVPVVYVSRLSIGPVDFQTVPALIVEGDDSTVMGGIRSYGRIGRETLAQLRLTLHYPRNLLLMDRSPPEPIPSGGVAFTTHGRFVHVPVTVETPNGPMTVPFVFDAGASSTVLDRRWAAKHDLAPRGGASAKLASFSVGGVFEQERIVPLGDMHELPYTGEPLGIIGTDLMRGLSVTFDFPRSLVWLEPVEEDDPPTSSEKQRTGKRP